MPELKQRFEGTIEACQEHSCPEPQLRSDNGLWIELGFADVGVTPQVIPQVTPQVERLLTVLHGAKDFAAVRIF